MPKWPTAAGGIRVKLKIAAHLQALTPHTAERQTRAVMGVIAPAVRSAAS